LPRRAQWPANGTIALAASRQRPADESAKTGALNMKLASDNPNVKKSRIPTVEAIRKMDDAEQDALVARAQYENWTDSELNELAENFDTAGRLVIAEGEELHRYLDTRTDLP
jgi:hypothetical protein